MQANQVQRKRFKILPEMEGRTARWYARNRGSASQLAEYRGQAVLLTEGLPDGAAVLEVAPGPGYQAVEIAKRGPYQVTGLDISRTMVDLARERARQEGVSVDFRQGDVAQMPFEAGSFDLVVCQAAFKNFTLPVRALDEMYRVLRSGGTAVIQDLRKDASGADIDQEVQSMKVGRLDSFMVRRTLAMLRRRAYTPDQFTHLVAQSAFHTCSIQKAGIGMEIRLQKA